MPRESRRVRIRPAAEIIERDNEAESIDDLPLGASALRRSHGGPRGPPISIESDFPTDEPASTSRTRPSLTTSTIASTVSSFVPPEEASTTAKFFSHVVTSLKRTDHWVKVESKRAKLQAQKLLHEISKVDDRVSDHERRLSQLEGQRLGHPGTQQGHSTTQKGRTKCPHCGKDLAAASLHAHKKRFHSELTLMDRPRA